MLELSVIRDLVAIFGVIAGFSYYVLTVRANQHNQKQQLETRQAQLFMQVYGRWNEESFSKQYTHFLYGLHWSSYEELKEKILSDIQNWETIANVIRFFEGVGVLVNENLVELRLITLTMSTDIITYWEKIQPYIDDVRREYDSPRLADQSELLYNKLKKYMKEHPEVLARSLVPQDSQIISN